MISNAMYRPVLFGGVSPKKRKNFLDDDGYLKKGDRIAFEHPLLLKNQPIVLGALPQLTKLGDLEMHVLPMFKRAIHNHSNIRDAAYKALERFFKDPKLDFSFTWDNRERFNKVYRFVSDNTFLLDFPRSLTEAVESPTVKDLYERTSAVI